MSKKQLKKTKHFKKKFFLSIIPSKLNRTEYLNSIPISFIGLTINGTWSYWSTQEMLPDPSCYHRHRQLEP